MPKSTSAAAAAAPGKMADHFYSPEARLDLLEIWERIAEDNVDAADHVEQEIRQAVSMLADNPGLGHFRRDLTPSRFVSGPFIPTSLSMIRTRGRWRSFAS